MCVGFLITNFPSHSPIKKVILFNRDETLSRPTEPLDKHRDDFVYGLDIRSKGTWLGLSQTKFAFITHYIDLPFKPVTDPKFRRGKIVRAVLKRRSPVKSKSQLAQVFSSFVKQRQSFNGFNLVVGSLDSDAFGCYSNGDQSPVIFDNADASGGVRVFGVSNGHPFSPQISPKIDISSYRIKQAVDNWLNGGGRAQSESELMGQLRLIMTDFTDPGVNSDPEDSANNDIFTRPYFRADRASVLGTVSSTFIVVREGGVEATEVKWDFSQNEEIKEELAAMDELRTQYLRSKEKEEREEILESLERISMKAMNSFKTPHEEVKVTYTLKK